MKMRRLIALLLSIVLSVSALSAVAFAAGDPELSLVAEKYNSATGQYESVTVVKPGDEVRITLVTNSAIEDFAGIRATVGFDTTAFTLRANSVASRISDSNGTLNSTQNADASAVTVLWDTTTKNLNVPGAIFSMVFVAKSQTADTTANFTLSVAELCDSYGDELPHTTKANLSVTVAITGLSMNLLAPYAALETITYPDSWEDILAADAAFNQLTAAQVKSLVNLHTAYWNWYSTAKTRYWALEEQSGTAAVDDAINAFMEKHKTILAKTVDTVTLADETALTAASSEYEALSSLVKSRFDRAVPTLLSNLQKRMKELKKAQSDAEKAPEEYRAFQNNYNIILTMDDALFKATFDSVGGQVEEALLAYDMMSDSAKALAAKEHKRLNELYALLQELIAQSEEEQKILQEVADFNNRWKYVIGLTARTVTLGDKSAVEMMLAEIEAQRPEVAQRLELRKSLGEKLLEAIKKLDSGSQEPGKVVETIVEVEVEKTVEVPGKQIISGMPDIIPILLAVLLLSILLLIFPTVKALKIYKAKAREATQQ